MAELAASAAMVVRGESVEQVEPLAEQAEQGVRGEPEVLAEYLP